MRAKSVMVSVGAAAGLAVIGAGAGAVWDGASGPFALPPEMPADQIPADVLALIGEPGEPLDAVVERIEAAFRAHMASRWIEGEGDRERHMERFVRLGERVNDTVQETHQRWIDRGRDFYAIDHRALWGDAYAEAERGVMKDESDWADARRMTREWLNIARDSGLLDSVMRVEAYRLAVRKVIDPERAVLDSGFSDYTRSVRWISRLLLTEAVDHFQSGRVDRGVEAIGVLFEIAEIPASQGLVLDNLMAMSVYASGARQVIVAVDRGVFDGGLALKMLSRMPRPSWRSMRTDHAYWIYDDLYINGVNALPEFYMTDGRLRVPIAMKSLLMEDDYHMFRFPALRERGTRHANAGELVAALENWISAALDEYAKPTRARDLSRLGFPRQINGALLPMAPGSPEVYFEALDTNERDVGATELALAIEVYRGEHGRVPERLEDLTPGVLKRLPEDPFAPDGRFRYRPDGASRVGYILYSVGDNGEDFGGVRETAFEYDSPRTITPGTDFVILPRR